MINSSDMQKARQRTLSVFVPCSRLQQYACLQVSRPLNSSRNHCATLRNRRHIHCRTLQRYRPQLFCSNASSRSTVSCRSTSNSNSSNPPSKESFDQYLSIVSSSSWQQLYNIFYDHNTVPSYQQCYGTLLQLLELLPELQGQQAAGAAAAAYSSSVSNSANINEPALGGWRGSPINSDGTAADDREEGWRALAAAGKVQTALEVTALKSFIRDILQAIQLQLYLYNSQELLDVLEASVLLSQPSSLWLQAWEAATQPQLKQLQLPQLMQAAEGLIACGRRPSKPWAGVWFVALQPHIAACARQQLTVMSLALRAWGCRPPLSWTEPYMEALQATMSQNDMSAAELLIVLGACVSLGLKPCEEWLRIYESASQRVLSDCSHSQLAVMAQGLQLLGHSASVEWLLVYLQAVEAGLGAWDIGSLGSVMMVLGQQPAALEALKQHDSSSEGLLAAVIAHTQPLIEQPADPAAFIQLLSGFDALRFTPPDEYLDLLLDETAARITAKSAALLQQQQARLNDDFKPAVMPESPSNNSTSSGHMTDNSQVLPGSNQKDEQLWVQAGSYKADRNINLGTARKQLETSWNMGSLIDGSDPVTSRNSSGDSCNLDSQDKPPLSSSNSTAGPIMTGANAAAAATAAAGVIGAMQASASIVGELLRLLSVVADMELPVDRSWAAEVLGALKGHCVMVDLPQLQLLLELCQRFGVVLEPDLVDEMLIKSHVDYTKLQPQDQLRLLSLLAASQTRPNNIWWQTFLSSLQHSLQAHPPAQLVMLLASMSGIGGRPPQAWLAAHESALLTNNTHSKQALSPEGWLLLLECYAQLMYQPSGELESVFERYMAGVLGPHTSLSPGGLASLVGSVGRLQLACSSQLEDGIIGSLDQVLPRATVSELQQLVQGLLLLDIQLPSPTLYQLCEVAEPHLASFTPSATCCLLQLLASAGEYPPSPKWLSRALSGLEPKLAALEARAALMLLQSLKAFAARPPERFMTALQQQLLHVVQNLDAMGIAAVLQGLAACGCMPGPELQLDIAGHIKKGLARRSQGMGPTPLWLVLEVLVQVPVHAASTVLLDEVLRQAAQQLALQGSVTSSRMLQMLMPHLAAAVTPGGGWGLSYCPPSEFCDALCSATAEAPGLLSPTLWLDLLLRFSNSDIAGFSPAGWWVTAATGQVLRGWSTGQGSDTWAAAPADQFAALIGALGRLTQQNPEVITAVEQFPGWPCKALVRLSKGLMELKSHQMTTALIGVSQLYSAAEQAAAAAGTAHVDGYSSNRDGSVSSTDEGSVSGMEECYNRTRKGIMLAVPELLLAAEAASLPMLRLMSGDDLAWLVHAMQQLNHVPSPDWVRYWASAAVAQLPGASGQSGVMCLAAIAAYEAQPDPGLMQQLLNHCQQHMGELQLPELLALGRSLQLLGYKPNEGFLRGLARAGAARVDAVGQRSGARVALEGARGVVGPDLQRAAMMELQKVLLGLQLQDDP